MLCLWWDNRNTRSKEIEVRRIQNTLSWLLNYNIMKEELVFFNTVFEQELLDEIDLLSERASFSAGEVIIDYGQIIRQMPLIIKGSV